MNVRANPKHQRLKLLGISDRPYADRERLRLVTTYCVIVIEILIPCWLAEPDGPAVEETVT